jgi:uncharacterized membrane protein YcaP (DUF421 family)
MDVVVRAALMYLVVLFTLRMTTRRIMRTSAPIDMALIFLIGGAAIQAALGGDQSITGVLLGIGTVAATHMVISAAKIRWAIVGRISDGTPVVLYADGRWLHEDMKRLRIQIQDVMAEVRQNGHKSLDEIETAVAEHNGAITILAKR